MANKIILPTQIMPAQALANSISGKIKKIFFQTEIISISGDDATCRVIAYAANKKNPNKWDIGTKVTATADLTKPVKKFTLPLAFGNCEWVNTNVTKKRSGESGKAYQVRIKQAAAIKHLNKIADDKATLKKTKLIFKAKKWPNPHIDFTVYIDSGIGNPTSASANPSPPAPPEE